MASKVQVDPCTPEDPPWARSPLTQILLISAGLLIRLLLAHAVFLNPDEALHYLLSLQPDLQSTYRATLTTAHPPLYILLLHCWGYLGNSELFLRLPSVLAGTAFAWMIYLWLKRTTNQTTAVLGMTLSLFSPALVLVSTELRQYALLLFFCASALYWLDRSLAEKSRAPMLAAGFFLWLALLTHYSAFLFALTVGIYALLRMRASKIRSRTPAGIAAIWSVNQVVALAITAILFKTHISKLKSRGMPTAIADSYLRGSIFHAGENHVLSFIFKTTIRLFHYLFSQEAIGIVGLLLVGIAIYGLARTRIDYHRGPSSGELAVLLAFPFLINCAAAIGGLYPYGGSRHNSYLAIFAFTAIAIALAQWSPRHSGALFAAVTTVLLICNLFPAPTGQYIRPQDQSRKQMYAATAFLRQNVPAGSVILTDDEGGLLLSHYLCEDKVVQFTPPFLHLFEAPCGPVQVISLNPRQWIFHAATFHGDLLALEETFHLPTGEKLWLFQAGWLIDKEPDLRAQLSQFGCPATHDFGRNILVCQITLP